MEVQWVNGTPRILSIPKTLLATYPEDSLLEGNNYKVIVKKEWRDQTGRMLEKNYSKNFYSTKKDTISPDCSNWIIDPPKAGNDLPWRISFPEPLDWVLLKTALQLRDSTGHRVRGEFITTTNESSINFQPSQAWKPGKYRLIAESRLEDLAGNNMERAFDQFIPHKVPGSSIEFVKDFRIR